MTEIRAVAGRRVATALPRLGSASIILLDHLQWLLHIPTVHIPLSPPPPALGMGRARDGWEVGVVRVVRDPTDTCHVGHTTLWYTCALTRRNY